MTIQGAATACTLYLYCRKSGLATFSRKLRCVLRLCCPLIADNSTLTPRKVFSATHMSRQKTDNIDFASADAKLCEAFLPCCIQGADHGLHPVFIPSALFALVFAPCGKAAANMPLGLVQVQKGAHLPVQGGIYPRQTIGQVLVYGGLGDAELLCGGTDGGLIIYDVRGKVADPFLNICTHMHHSQFARS